MKSKTERSERLSLLLLTSGIVLIFLILTTLIVGMVILILVWSGALRYGEAGIDAWDIFFYTVLFSLVIGSILTFFAMRLPLKPVNKVLNAMHSLSKGEYFIRLHFRGPFANHPTVREMTDSFNTMASELEQTEMLRSDFVNNFSHEFKTPIVSIAGFARVLKKGNLSQQEQMEYLTIIEEESLRLSQMATNVLALTKVENQTILTDKTRYNLSEQLRTCVLMLEGKWSKKDIEPVLPTSEHYITGSKELLRQVWVNLIDNAIKFSPEHRKVEINITEKTDDLTIDVINFGEEIPEEKRAKIFNKFYQGDESHATDGNGVGLAIVKQIVQLHEGTVDVNCEEEKVIFSVSLPKQ